MSNWLQDAIWEGLQQVDTDQLLQDAAAHVTLKGEWMQGVISPSLCSITCPLQRLKVFLGHQPLPFEGHMAVRAGAPDGVTNLNFLRGFFMEGVLVAALKAVLGDDVIDHAPLYNPVIERDGVTYSAHPDVLLVNPQGELELAQIKAPSVFKMDRVRKLGLADVATSYLPQMACEMFVVRGTGVPVVRNNLVLAGWEATPKQDKNRVAVYPYDWAPQTDMIPVQVAEEVMRDLIHQRTRGVWPDALPEHQWDVFPCSYCRFSRLGDYLREAGDIPRCDDHTAWEKPTVTEGGLAS